MAAQDMVFKAMPKKWTEGPFMGNGMIGTLVFQDSSRSVRWQIGRGDCYEHRSAANKHLLRSAMFDNSRLPIGYFTLETVGTIVGGSARLDLWNAECKGSIETDKGHIQWRSYVHAELMLIVVETQFSPGEQGVRFQWHPEEAVAPRVTFLANTSNPVKNYVANPRFQIGVTDGISTCVQPLLAGGQTTTAWSEVTGENARTLYVTIEHTYPLTTSTARALQTIKAVGTSNPATRLASHRAWWHRFYAKSFLSLPTPQHENFYWAQIYKLACATRSGRALADLNGPWLQPTGWPAVWWNMNVQLTYSPALVAHHPELAAALLEHLDRGAQTLVENVPEKYRHDSAFLNRVTGPDLVAAGADPENRVVELGNLTWALHNCYMHARHTMDKEMMRRRIFPLLKRAINYYLHFLRLSPDGRLHLAIKTISPEYGYGKAYGNTSDCNYDLALIRWGCQTLLEICRKCDLADPLIDRWQETVERLTDYPADKNGYMVGRDVSFAESHRHWSHLLMVYPLYLVNIEQPDNLELLRKSVAHWFSMPERWMGFSYAGASSIAASLGNGTVALDYLDLLLRPGGPGRTQANTFSYEGGGPIIETSLAGTRAIQDMLLQSWGDKIRVFPAVPGTWDNVEFHHLSAEGAFLVSARRQARKTVWIRVQSLGGELCRLQIDMADEIKVAGLNKERVKWGKPGLAEIAMGKGEEVLLYTTDEIPDEPVAGPSYSAEQGNFYGVHR